MKTESKLKAHLFICTHLKSEGESCGAKNSKDLFLKLKEISKNREDWKNVIRINQSGCLGQCSQGIACVLYPQNEWRTRLDSSETSLKKLEELIEEALKP